MLEGALFNYGHFCSKVSCFWGYVRVNAHDEGCSCCKSFGYVVVDRCVDWIEEFVDTTSVKRNSNSALFPKNGNGC